MPLVATWTESDVLFGAERTYCHTFYALADGSALAFFQFADPADQELFKTEINFTPFRHIALAVDQDAQDAIKERIASAGYVEPAHVRPRPRLLRLALRHRPQRAHPGVHRRSPQGRRHQRRAPR